MKTLIIISMIVLMNFHNSSVSAQGLDFGDAPDPLFPTLQVNDGARHFPGLLYLGSRVDYETDASATMFADGDDLAGSIDDEDGVIFNSWLVPGQNANISVYASGSGLLNAWMDFNLDGDWNDANEQIFNDYALIAGANNISFMVPASVPVGVYSYARFRFSTQGFLQPTGSAADGEVEDYRVYLGLPSASNIVVDPDAGLSNCQNEISLTIVPGSGNVVAAYNDYPFPGGNGLGVSYSSDKGNTWTALQLPYPMNPFSGIPLVDAFDPSVTSNDSGHVFVAHISTDYKWGNGPVSGLYVHKSVDGGASWLPPVTVSVDGTATQLTDSNYRFNDRCQITSDKNPASLGYNNVYIAWIKDRGWNMPMPYSDIYFSVSKDGGMNFSAPVVINSPANAMGNMPVPAVASNGDIYVLWVDYDVTSGGNGILLLNKSSDASANWGTDISVDTILLPPLYLNNYTDVRAKGAAVLKTSPVNPNELYVVYAADPDTAGADEADIFFIRSIDGGLNWSQRLRINDDISNNDQILPWMDVKPSGIIEIVWYDRRNDPFDMYWDVYYASSTDGGMNFFQNVKLNANAFSSPQTLVGSWYGEYPGLAVDSLDAYVAFTSSEIDLKGDIFFTKYSNPFANISQHKPLNIIETVFVYPNPANDRLNIVLKDFASSDVCNVKIYNTYGKLVYDVGSDCLEKIMVNIEQLNSGVYFISVTKRNKILSSKFIKN